MSGLQLSKTEGKHIAELQNFLNLGFIHKVEVCTKEQCWNIIIEFKNLLSYAQLLNAAQLLKKCHVKLKKVNIYPCYDLSNLSINELNDKINLIKDNLCWLLPGLKSWSKSMEIIFEENIMRLQLPSKLGVEVLLKDKYDKLIKEYLIRNFKLDLQILIKHVKQDVVENNEEAIIQNYLNKLKKERELNSSTVDNKDSDKIHNPNHIFGKPTKATVIEINDIDRVEDKYVAIVGEIFAVETRKLKNGNNLIIINVTDNKNSVSVKIFEKENMQLNSPLKNGLFVKIIGTIQFDRFSGEKVLIAKSIEKANKIIKKDNCEKKRIELHLHTKMSAMDGLSDIEDCVKQASSWGHKAIAITDHGVVQAFPNAYYAGKKYGVKIIYGVEGYLIDNENDLKNSNRYHIIILAKNKEGLYNLYKLISISHLEYFHRRPLIPKSILKKYRKGLILGTACEAGELIQAYLNGAEYNKLLEIASEYDYLEIQPNGNNLFLIEKGIIKSVDDLREMNKCIVKLGKELNKPVVATGDVHFLNAEDDVYRQILMAGQGYKDDNQAPLFYRTTEEMLEEFSYLPEADRNAVVIDNTHKIADSIEELTPVPQEFYPPNIDGADETIRHMTWTRAKQIYGEPLPEIVENRINKELDSIISNGYAVLYLIAQKLVKKSNDDGYLVGSRGSVGSSLVATLTGITEVNPLAPHYLCLDCKYSEFITDGSVGSGADLLEKNCPKCGKKLKTDGHQIPFEVFMGFKGDKVPDIDLNFSGEYQAIAHKYTEELFGEDKVFKAGTIATVAAKTAFGFVKNYLDEKKINCRSAERDRLVIKCTGVKRTTGQHPGGLMIVPDNMDIHQFTPIQRPADDPNSGVITTHFDYHSIGDQLVKLDILGHDDPTIIKMLEDFTGLDAQEIPLNDKETMKIFSGLESLNLREPNLLNSTVGTIGIPEFGTKFVRGMLEDTRPTTFAELVRISGLSHGTDVWLNNAQNLIRDKVVTLNETIACRDDIMVYLIEKGLPHLEAFKIMEDVRKGKGLKEEYIKLMKEHNVPQWYVDSCQKIKYMFPKAHAVAYVTMAFRIAYFKVHHPLAYYAAFFSVRGDDFDAQLICQGEDAVIAKMKEIEELNNDASAKEKSLYNILEVALEMYLRGIKVKMVDLMESDAFKFKIVGDELLCPFISLQGVGLNAAKNIVDVRNKGNLKSIEDLQIKAKLTKTVIQVLKDNRILSGLPDKNQLTLF